MSGFDFDTERDRRGVPALKTHPRVVGTGGAAVFAAGVADMDFEVAPAIRAALAARLADGVFGYEAVPDDLIPALTGWLAARHGWHVPEAQVLRAPNALNALAIAASLFAGPGEGIIVQPPVFFDFYDVIRENDRQVLRNPLVLRDGRYEMDFAGLEAVAASERARMLFLCNPQNPMGRVWTRAELERVAAICLRHGVLVVSDELHADILHGGHRHTPFAAVSADAAAESVTILSPAKSFNIAGCCAAFTVVPDAARRAAFQAENSRLTVNKNNAFSNVAMLAAYREGAAWLDAVTAYLAGNIALLQRRLAGLSGVAPIAPEAGFLVWLDCRGLGLAPEALMRFLREEAGWAPTRGAAFGPEGDGFVRVNVACPRAVLARALDRLEAALRTPPAR